MVFRTYQEPVTNRDSAGATIYNHSDLYWLIRHTTNSNLQATSTPIPLSHRASRCLAPTSSRDKHMLSRIRSRRMRFAAVCYNKTEPWHSQCAVFFAPVPSTRMHSIICLSHRYVADTHRRRTYCPNCYGTGMIMIRCTHTGARRTVVSRPSASQGTPGPTHHGSGGGSGSGGSRRSAKSDKDPTPVRSVWHS